MIVKSIVINYKLLKVQNNNVISCSTPTNVDHYKNSYILEIIKFQTVIFTIVI